MEIKDVKRYLYNNPNKIVDLLEDCGCHHIKHYENKRVQSCRPNGDNITSVQVLLSDTNLNTVIHTSSDYDGGDIFYLVSHFKNMSNSDAIKYVYNFLGFNMDYKPKEPSALDFVDEFVRYDISHDKYNEAKNEPLPDILYQQFIDAPHKSFTDEGISIATQNKFNICFDQLSDRIVIPIYDLKGNTVTFKGRAIDDDVEPKYVAYYSFNGSNIIYGYHQNLFNITRADEVIVFEAEKSVLKADTIGIDNTLAIMRHKVSEKQINTLIKLQVPIVWAMDKGIPAHEILYHLKKFDDLAEIYVIYDRHNLLNDKDAPIDLGEDIFMELYNDKIPLKEFENLVEEGIIN